MSGISITKRHVFTTGPRKGQLETRKAHLFADGFYRVYSPEGVVGDDGKRRRNVLENARLLTRLSEAADHVEKGWGIRMSGPLTPTPSLCTKNIEVVR